MNPEIEDIIFVIDDLLDDPTMPKNVKLTLDDIKSNVSQSSGDVVKLSEAIYALQEISEDVNLPLNSKSDIWMLQSKIEKLKEFVK